MAFGYGNLRKVDRKPVDYDFAHLSSRDDIGLAQPKNEGELYDVIALTKEEMKGGAFDETGKYLGRCGELAEEKNRSAISFQTIEKKVKKKKRDQ